MTSLKSNIPKRGNIQKAILASYDTNRKRTHDELTRDFYAPSCQDSRQSVWKTWCTIAQAWNLLPVPLTEELVLAVGASLKHGGYRASKNYFSRAQQETQGSVWRRGTTKHYCTHRQNHQVDQQRHRPYGLQRFLRAGTFSLTLTD